MLLAEEATRGPVQPIYVRAGLAWEPAECRAIEAFLAAWNPVRKVNPPASLAVDMRDVYPSAHWAVVGRPPGYDTPDEDVYLPGRNIVLLGKAGVYCAMSNITRLVIGTLGHNPFADATPAFRQAMATALSIGLAHPIAIEAPYGEVDKRVVIRRGAALGVPMELTLSCMNPGGTAPSSRIASHCGTCSKCRERHDAFVSAGIPDPTTYADGTFVGR